MGIRTTLGIAALAIGLTACGGGQPENGAAGDGGDEFNLVTSGTLTVCTDAPYRPMEFEEGGEFTGFDIELMRAIGEQLELEVEVFNSGFEPITSGSAFAAQSCDIAASSITITDERDENVDFSDPYFQADQSLLVKKDAGISSLGDLADGTIGVQTGTTGETYANENAPPGATVQSFDNVDGLFLGLESGSVDAVLQDLVANQGRVSEDDTVEVVETYPTDERYGLAFPEEGSDALRSGVNDALATLQEDGTYDQLYEEWFGRPPPEPTSS